MYVLQCLMDLRVPDKPTLTVLETAAFLAVSETSIYRWIKAGQLQAVGKPKRITRESLEEFVRNASERIKIVT